MQQDNGTDRFSVLLSPTFEYRLFRPDRVRSCWTISWIFHEPAPEQPTERIIELTYRLCTL